VKLFGSMSLAIDSTGTTNAKEAFIIVGSLVPISVCSNVFMPLINRND